MRGTFFFGPTCMLPSIFPSQKTEVHVLDVLLYKLLALHFADHHGSAVLMCILYAGNWR